MARFFAAAALLAIVDAQWPSQRRRSPGPSPSPHGHDPFAGSNCTCSTFCAGSCAIFPEKPKNVTWYRVTPLHVDDLADKNTGDSAGDTSYLMMRRTAASDCAKHSTSFQCKSLIVKGDDPDSTDLVIAFDVEIDGQWGPYLMCNPADAEHPEETWNCRGMSSSCQCDRLNQVVGRENLTGFGTGHGSQMAAGGEWYSTPAAGMCQPGATVLDGNCSWRIVGAKAVNASCVYDRLDSNIEKHNEDCFKPCPTTPGGGLNHTSDCYSECYANTIKTMKKEELFAPWDAAFKSSQEPGSCPPVGIPRSTLASMIVV